jgi:hypothetical protein
MQIQSRSIFLSVLATAFVSMSIAEVKPSAKPAFSISISVESDVVKTGSPVLVKIAKINVSDHDIPFAVGGSKRHVITFDVRDSDGKSVSETSNGIKAHGKGPFVGSVFSAKQKSGVVQKQEIDISTEYKLNKPGKYTIQAQERDFDSQTIVKSNRITITVIE